MPREETITDSMAYAMVVLAGKDAESLDLDKLILEGIEMATDSVLCRLHASYLFSPAREFWKDALQKLIAARVEKHLGRTLLDAAERKGGRP